MQLKAQDGKFLILQVSFLGPSKRNEANEWREVCAIFWRMQSAEWWWSLRDGPESSACSPWRGGCSGGRHRVRRCVAHRFRWSVSLSDTADREGADGQRASEAAQDGDVIGEVRVPVQPTALLPPLPCSAQNLVKYARKGDLFFKLTVTSYKSEIEVKFRLVYLS